MATLVASKVSAGVQPKGMRVGLVAVTSVYSIAASLSTGDVIQMVKVPANATPIFMAVSSAGAGACSVNVGDANDTDRFIQGAALSSSAAPTYLNNAAYVPYTYSVDDTIDLTVSASASFSPGASGSITLVAIFSMDV